MFSIFNLLKEKSHLEKELELLQNNLKEGYSIDSIISNINKLKVLLSKVKERKTEPSNVIDFLEYVDAWQLGELKTTNSDLKNLNKVFNGTVLLSFNKNIFNAFTTTIQSIKKESETDNGKILDTVLHNSGWKLVNEEWYEFPLYINSGMYYIEVNFEKGYPIFNNGWDSDQQGKLVDKCDRGDFNIKLKNADLISLIENAITMLNGLEKFVNEYNRSVQLFVKIDSELRNEKDLIEDHGPEIANLVKWLNSSFELRNCFCASALGLTNSLVDFIPAALRE